MGRGAVSVERWSCTYQICGIVVAILLPTAHSAVVTVAIFAPVPGLFANEGLREVGEVIVSADYQGGIKVFVCGPDL